MTHRRTLAVAILGSAALGTVAVAALSGTPAPVSRPDRGPPRFAFTEDFAAGLCTGRCPGAHWAIRQEVRGRVDVVPAPGRPGQALRATTEAKADGVAKADIVHRSAMIRPGQTITVGFDLYVPTGTPLNSLQLVDLECASCGESGNPGIRLYLRRGRLRVDRAKIGIRHAWTRDDAPVLAAGRWHRIVWRTRVGTDDDAGIRVTLDGREVLAASGATVMTLSTRGIDRIQIGITANSNPVPATAYFAAIAVDVRDRTHQPPSVSVR